MSVINDYIQQQDEPKCEALQRVYDIVHTQLPEVEDGWKYGIATFLYKDRPLFGFATTKTGISLYPYGNSTIAPFMQTDITPYVTGGGTLSFKSGIIIPDTLVEEIITIRKAYITEIRKK